MIRRFPQSLVVAQIILILATPLIGQENHTDPRLAKGRKVFVEKAEKDADVAIIKELQEWGWWEIVSDESEAELRIRLRVSGSGAWGVAHLQASVLDPATKKTLWVSKDQKGTRTIFHGYASPFARAAEGIVKQMKKAIK